ncbi:MAG: hypothetical protein WCO56_15450 [Verrucomicrobiota bacterium]
MSNFIESATAFFMRKKDQALLAGQNYTVEQLQNGVSLTVGAEAMNSALTELAKVFHPKQNRKALSGLVIAQTTQESLVPVMERTYREPEDIVSYKAPHISDPDALLSLYQAHSAAGGPDELGATLRHAFSIHQAIEFIESHEHGHIHEWGQVAAMLNDPKRLAKQVQRAHAALVFVKEAESVRLATDYFLNTWPQLDEAKRAHVASLVTEMATAADDPNYFHQNSPNLSACFYRNAILVLSVTMWNPPALMAAEHLHRQFAALKPSHDQPVFLYHALTGTLAVKVI